MTGASLPQIGRAFGDRDHTTVLHATRKVEALLSFAAPAADVLALREMVEEALWPEFAA